MLAEHTSVTRRLSIQDTPGERKALEGLLRPLRPPYRLTAPRMAELSLTMSIPVRRYKDFPVNGPLSCSCTGLQGADGESIQGAAIPGTGTAESPGGAAVSGLVGSSEGGELINSGSGIDNDGGLGGTPGAGGVSESGLARGGQGAS